MKGIVKQKVRVNRQIRANEVRLITSDGKQAGIVPFQNALDIAVSEGLDLVEVAPEAEPPVCKIMDYGKFKYEQSKRSQQAKKKQVTVQVKEVKFRPKIEDHDFQFKLKNIRKFLEQKNRIKVTLMFRGREIAFKDLGLQVMARVVQEMGDEIVVEQHPRLEGRTMTMMLSPKS